MTPEERAVLEEIKQDMLTENLEYGLGNRIVQCLNKIYKLLEETK